MSNADSQTPAAPVPPALASSILLPAQDYDLGATLDSGQVFRWARTAGGGADAWVGVVGKHWVRLTPKPGGILAEAGAPQAEWDWLRQFLQNEVDLGKILDTFPDDEPMRRAVAACRGLRVLRQEPWECLASFILSSTKQIVQIRQIIRLLGERFGEPLRGGGADPPAGPGERPREVYYTFPTPQRLARVGEDDLRGCKMGFRAPHLLAAARRIADGSFDLERIRGMDYASARRELMELRGVGGKIADCVLLFAYGFESAFPVDVWVERGLRQLYFPRRRVAEKKLRHFAATHFGRHAGYAQQYLFHYVRTQSPRGVRA